MLGPYLRQIMAERNMTITDISNATGVSRSILSEVINGKRKSVSPLTMEKLSTGLGVTVEELLKGRYSDEGYVFLIKQLEKEGITPERLMELLEWVKKIKTIKP